MASKALPCPTLLRLLLDYNADSGMLMWKPRKPWMFPLGGRFSREVKARQFNANFAGCEAFTARNIKGYAVGAVRSKPLMAHRVIWAMQTGRWPSEQIDHQNHVTDDNRLNNLREASASQNMGNRRQAKTAKRSKYKGVCWAEGTGLWTAAISIDGKQTHLGSFETEQAAAIAYADAARKKYGEFAFTNFR